MPPPDSDRRRRRISLPVLLVAGVLFAAVASELSLRWVLGLGNPVLVAPDRACGYILKPDQNVDRFFCHTHIDRYGMRSDAFPAEPAAGTLRILFVGDSVTYGTSRIDQPKIFTEILHRDLPGIVQRPVEVLNASASAWAIDNELSFVRSRGIFHAQLVILVLNSGDPGQARAEISDLGDDTTLHHSSSALGELWTRYVKRKLFHSRGKVDAGDVAAGNAEATVRANLADLGDFENLVAAQHARLAIVYVPFAKEIPRPAAQAEDELKTWTAAHRVPFFDLTAVESAYPVQQITLDGDHFNVRGHELVARAIEKQWVSVLGR